MDPQEELMQLLNDTIDAVKMTVRTLEAAAPLLGQRHQVFQDEATRLITTLRIIERDVLGLLDAGDIDPEFEALMYPTETPPVACGICSHTIQPGERQVPIAGGGVVHITCADSVAAEEHARRQLRAQFHGLVFVAVMIAFGYFSGITPWLIVLMAFGVAIHLIAHRRWWYYLRRDLGRWLLLGLQR